MVLAVLALPWCGCGPADGRPDAGPDADVPGDVADAVPDDGEEAWVPPEVPVELLEAIYAVVPASELAASRSGTLHRGILHAHSPYSHDACDDQGFVDGVRNEACFEQLRAALCETAQDFLFLSDHADVFADHEFPDVLLAAPGDAPIVRGGVTVANRVVCPDGRRVVVAAGTETGTMPLGLEGHVGATPAERHAAYSEVSAAAVERFKAAGALAFVHHTEEWDPAVLAGLPLDGIEIYNLHRNLMDRMGDAVNLVLDLQSRPWRVPVVEIGLVGLFESSEADLSRWARLVAVRPTTGILATDVHRNVFDGTSPDGERIDSYRRLMHWFSNYLPGLPADADDGAIKAAIRAGRLFGVFDYLGYAAGFDFRLESGGVVHEMGARVVLEPDARLRLDLPRLHRLPPGSAPPAIRGRILRAEGDDWVEVAGGTGPIDLPLDRAGVYRAEVLQTPHHLRAALGTQADRYETERVWVYANPIYVSEP